MEKVVELQAKNVRFFSLKDEAAFFEWLDKLSCVEACVGKGLTIYVSINKEVVTEEDLRELLSLFRRYEIPLSQLVVFDEEKFSSWLRDPKAYWFESMFRAHAGLTGESIKPS